MFVVSGYPWVRFWFAIKFYSSDPNHLREEITRSESNQTKPNHLREEITRSETIPNQTKPSERGDHQVRIIAIITKCRLLNRAQDLPFIRHTFPGVTITE